MKNLLKTLIAASVFAAGAAAAEPTLVNDDAWITGQKQSAPAPRAAAGSATGHAHHRTPPENFVDVLARQPISYGD